MLMLNTYEIDKTKVKKSAGLDKISNKLLKSAGEIIINSLTFIFNLSINTGTFPDELKYAKVTPIYKSEDRKDCSNYRPISVISAVAKVFEKLVYKQLSQYFDDNHLLSTNQSGFRTQHSTESTLLHSTNQCLINMDKGFINGLLFLDLKKAFDTVDHKILIDKLNLYGIQGLALQWFISYLSERRQVCKINREFSTVAKITCGVPQGSNQGVVKHGRGNGYGAPDLCVMQVPPAYIVFCSNSSALVFSGFHVCQFFLPNSGKNTRKRQVENDLQWFLGFFILLYVQWR